MREIVVDNFAGGGGMQTVCWNGYSSRDIMAGYRFVLLELRALEKQYERLLFVGGPGCSAGTGIYGEMRATNDRESAMIQAQDGLLKQLETARNALAGRAEAFETVLASVTDDRTRCVLRYYYGLGYSNERVAEVMGVSVRTALRVRLEYLGIK